MSKVKIEGNASGTGTFTIAAPNSNTDRTFNLPDEAGTVLTSASDLTSQVGSNIPAFDAKLTSSFSTSTGDTLLNSNAFTESYDYGSNFNASTGVFTAPIDGIYLFTVKIWTSANDASTDFNVGFAINSSPVGLTAYITSTIDIGTTFGATETGHFSLSASDTVCLYLYSNDGSWMVANSTRFSGFLVRAT
jgi:hypothetical protein